MTPPRDTPPLVLVVDDEAGHAEAQAEILERAGFRCETAFAGEEGLEKMRGNAYDVVVTDLVMHRVDGMDLLAAAKRQAPAPAVVMVTGHGSVESAVRAMRDGAYTYLTKPVNPEELRQVVKHAAEEVALRRRNVELERRLDEKYGLGGIIGNSEPMRRVFDLLKQIAPTDATVLILGESGTGKELIANAIHQNSPRRHRPFVALNCAALSETILESELFGHEKGAFTGALARRQGRFEYAHRGTLFLDEIGDMPATTQIKLLRVIEQKEITRVGSNEPVRVDVRLLAATHQALEKLVKQGRFREDLYYRLNVVRIELPPLRERREDIPLLVNAFIKEFPRGTRRVSLAGQRPRAQELHREHGRRQPRRRAPPGGYPREDSRRTRAPPRPSTAAGRQDTRRNGEGTYRADPPDGRRQPPGSGPPPQDRRANALPKTRQVRHPVARPALRLRGAAFPAPRRRAASVRPAA